MKSVIVTALVAVGLTASAAVEWWAVPAMSGERRMPDKDPTDGEKSGVVRIAMAQEEYEPGSFVVKSDADLGKVRFEISDFKLLEDKNSTVRLQPTPKNKVFPKENLDLKVVKVWYQCGNAWWSYFGDLGDTLCPELLLNDEDLIRVDTAKKANYARLPDGEQWLNLPLGLDTGFKCMRPEFHDAKTLQPVALEKNVRKQFILTAHATSWTVPGLYRGEIKIVGQGGRSREGQEGRSRSTEDGKHPLSTSTSTYTYATIPVAIRVYDFVLPPPKAYVHPEMDYLTCSCHYSNISDIMRWNGGDEELAWKQFEAMLADLLKHGQTMHDLKRGMGVEADRTLDLMQKVGLRTDVVFGGVSTWDFGNRKNNSVTNLVAWAKRQADYYDRKLGHHNIYVGFGDEPDSEFYERERWHFDIFQRAGFKFFMGSQNGIFSKVGYDWGWHDASKDPGEDAETPAMWNKLGAHTHCSWYANQHVGPENPDFNRRQYGLGAYLAGYSATCNYAHHFGPYNDHSDMYKPMVFAYGSGDGVIDTIQWEGYREGIDDIRYATEMCRLARAADATGDFEIGRLGRRALMYLAKVDRAKDPLDAIRGEMAAYILKLRAALGASAPGPVFFRKNDKFVFGSLVEHPKDTEREKGGRYWGFQREAVEASIVKLLTNPKEKDSARAKRAAASALIQLDHHPLGPAPLTKGKWDEAYADYCRIKGWTVGDTNFVWEARFALAYANVCREMGDIRETKFLYGLVTGGRTKDATEAQRFNAATRLALLDTPQDAKAVRAVCDTAYATCGKKLEKKALKAEIESLAKYVGGPGHEQAVRGVIAFRDSLYAARAPKKVCRVRYSKKPISGIAGFAAAEALSDQQKMDRPFGGNVDMFATDVATGDRGAVGVGQIDPAKAPRLDLLCDDWGLHVRFIIQDPDARKIESGLVGGPSIEGYIAPGDDAPYICNFTSLRAGELGFFNTAYDGRGHRRARAKDVANCRTDVAYADGVVTYYFAFSWDLYPTRIPANGTIWNFEQILWGDTSYTWNGVESAHGRSTWGQLMFELSDAARASILRKRLCKAVAAYKNEKRSHEMHEGVLDHWSDAVIGDLAFYNAEVKPLADELDKVCELVKPDMDDRTALDLAAKHLAAFEDLRFDIAARRAAYLLRRQTVK